VNKSDWISDLVVISQFVACLGRIIHHSPSGLLPDVLEPVQEVSCYFAPAQKRSN
jgi:hypothetical protein